MCGNTHLVSVLRKIYPNNEPLMIVQTVIMIGCAFISLVTAVIGFRLFPAVAETFQKFELADDGSIQHSENYLIEVVELIKESILILSDDLFVLRCNDVSRSLFGRPVEGTQITEYIKDSDLVVFRETVARVMGSYNFIPATIELRIRRDPGTASEGPLLTKTAANKLKARNKGMVYCARTETPVGANSKPPGSSKSSSSSGDEDFMWIEVTMCKGKLNNDEGGFDYDLKMVCRDIDDRKKRALYQTLIEGTEERGRINESKLRYLSCIAHDLKTPLQSFSFSLDLLNHTDLHPEQRDYVQQANVAVDLMKLTISQTMDISKALTGAKLTPRRTTVFISSVLNRVKIIINGYGKSVPVSFEVAPDVCDEIITDEEWLWQMLLNLLTNACKYTDKGSIKVRLSVTSESSISDSSETEKYQYTTLTPLAIPHVESQMLLCEVIDTGEYIHFPYPVQFFSFWYCVLTNLCGRPYFFDRHWHHGEQDRPHLRRFRAGAGRPGHRHGPGAVRRAHPRGRPQGHLRRATQHRVLHGHRHRAVVLDPLHSRPRPVGGAARDGDQSAQHTPGRRAAPCHYFQGEGRDRSRSDHLQRGVRIYGALHALPSQHNVR